MKKFLSFTLYLLFVPSLFGQVFIQGTILDASNNQPIQFANIYLANTQNGTVSNENGKYELANVSKGIVSLVISYVGYEQTIRTIDTKYFDTINLSIQLSPSSIDLAEVDVVARKSRKRKRYIKQFQQAFLGYTENAKKSKLLNPEVLFFEKKGDTLDVSAKEFIQIRNQSTGYDILFALENFELVGEKVTYSGKPIFKELIPASDKEKENWQSQREKTYKGSFKHFVDALIKDEITDDGFEVEFGSFKKMNEFSTKSFPSTDQIIRSTTSEYEYQLTIPQLLKVTYTNEKVVEKIQTSSLDMAGNNPSTAEMAIYKPQVSYVYLMKPVVNINANGLVNRPNLVLEYGYWSNERVADLLPLEYLATSSQSIPKEKKASVLNGFSLNDLIIPFDEIKQGTPQRDNIPAIDQPNFAKANDVQFLSDDDLVLAVNYNGISKAYPIRIMNWHEIVNDKFGDKQVVITYCPLCGSGIAFEASVNNRSLKFGVSGLLYNSDVLLYDKNTQSLWSQILGKSVGGKLSSQELKFISTTTTTWEDWKTNHPNGFVLTRQTGYKRDYTKMPYQRYVATDALMFPVRKKSNRYNNKEKMLGITINGQFKAFPFSELEKTNGEIHDTFEGKEIVIEFDKENQVGRLKTKDVIGYTVYWFAWYAFHSDTEVYVFEN